MDAGMDAGPDASDGGVGGPDAGVLPFCRLGCVTPADCATGSPLFDADNYACVDNACEFTGCNSTQECVDTFGNTDYVCGVVPPSPVPNCYLSCSTAADCELGSPAFDADNYACTDAKCQWLGCNTTQECIDTFASPDYVCATPDGAAFSSCFQTCAAPADCSSGSPAFDADNYACTAGRCDYLGCLDSAECQGTFMDSDYICQ